MTFREDLMPFAFVVGLVVIAVLVILMWRDK